MSSRTYDHQQIEAKWQARWKSDRAGEVDLDNTGDGEGSVEFGSAWARLDREPHLVPIEFPAADMKSFHALSFRQKDLVEIRHRAIVHIGRAGQDAAQRPADVLHQRRIFTAIRTRFPILGDIVSQELMDIFPHRFG